MEKNRGIANYTKKKKYPKKQIVFTHFLEENKVPTFKLQNNCSDNVWYYSCSSIDNIIAVNQYQIFKIPTDIDINIFKNKINCFIDNRNIFELRFK